jgi:Ser/Thr protein kinase RdoA (MazF antagonist)
VAAFQERSQRRIGLDDLGSHLEAHHGVTVSGLQPLDGGVYKVERAEGPAWVARIFPADRPLAEVEADAEILSWLSAAGYPAEPPVADPVSTHAGQGVLVTEWVEGEGCRGVERPDLFETLGDLLGRLQTLPLGGDAPAALDRPSGGWHSLSVDGGGKAADLDAVERLFDDLLVQATTDATAEAAYRQSAAREEIRTIIRAVDTGAGLPVAVTHPDFATPNVIVTPDGRGVLVDWTGVGTGPRVCSLGLLLWVSGGDPPLVSAVARGYRRHVTLEDEERRRLGSWCRGLGPVLAAWSVVYRGADPAPFARRMPAGLAQAEKTAALFCAQLDT